MDDAYKEGSEYHFTTNDRGYTKFTVEEKLWGTNIEGKIGFLSGLLSWSGDTKQDDFIKVLFLIVRDLSDKIERLERENND